MRKKFSGKLSILNLILAAAGLGWTIYSLFTVTPYDGHFAGSAAIHALNAAALIVAAVYCLTGYKHGAPFGTAVFALCAVSAFITTLFIREAYVFLPVLSILSFGILTTLTLAPELGRKKSFVLCAINVAIAVIRIPAYIIAAGQLPGGMVCNLLLAIILGVIIYARYAE